MGDMPFTIDRIPGKSAANLIINAAIRHFLQGEMDMVYNRLIMVEIPITQEKDPVIWKWKFRSSCITSVFTIKLLLPWINHLKDII